MKNLSSTQIANLSQQYGAEPIVVVAIQFGGNWNYTDYSGDTPMPDDQLQNIIANGLATSGASFFADKDVLDSNGNIIIPGKIIEISDITTDVDFYANSNTATVTVTLDDSDSSILSLLRVSKIHKRPAYVYFHFQGASISDMILIFEGQVVSDFKWSDKNKQVTFNFLSYVEQLEVGFSPEQGFISDLPLEMIGKPWPMGFGDIVKYPAMRINWTPVAILATPFGVFDQSLRQELARLQSLLGVYNGLITYYAEAALEAYYSGYSDIGDQMTDILNQVIMQVSGGGPGTIQYAHQSLLDILTQQQLYSKGLVFTLPSDPVGSTSGTGISGNISRAQAQGQLDVITDCPISLTGSFTAGQVILDGTLSPSVGRVGKFEITGLSFPMPGTYTWGSGYTPPLKDPFVYIDAGTQIEYTGNYPLRYLVNFTGGTVQNVYAYQLFGGSRRLMPVPQQYWNVLYITPAPPGVITSIPVFPSLVVETTQPLSTLRNQGWEDDLYVSYISDFGPDFQSIIRFFVHYYTIWAIDEASLGTVPAFNCSFVLTEQKEVMTCIKDVCFQCNVAVWLYEGVFYFNYLPNYIPPTLSLGLANILQDSVEISISSTEDIITKIRGSWRPNYQYDIRNYVCIRYNDNLYGIRSLEMDYFCFNDPTSVLTSMEAWIYRKGNVWKRIKMNVNLAYFQLDIFDNVLLGSDVVSTYMLSSSSTTLPASVIGMAIDPKTYTIELQLEVPVYVGSSTMALPYWYSQAAGIPLYKIDENYQLTETPQQYAFYQRGISIDQAVHGAQMQNDQISAALELNAAYYTAFNLPIPQYLQMAIAGLSYGIYSSQGLPSPNPITGDPAPTGVTKSTVTDAGGMTGDPSTGYSAPPTAFPQAASAPTPPTTQIPNWQYSYGNYPLNLTQLNPNVVMPGTADSSAGDGSNTYNCTVYPTGPVSGSQGSQVTAQLLTIDPSLTVPPGVWAMFCKVPASTLGSSQGITSINIFGSSPVSTIGSGGTLNSSDNDQYFFTYQSAGVSTYPGTINSQVSGSTYSCTIYKSSPGNAQTGITVQAQCLQILGTDVIPANTVGIIYSDSYSK